MAEKILPLVVDGCGPQRTHPAEISDGTTEKKGPGGKMAETTGLAFSAAGT